MKSTLIIIITFFIALFAYTKIAGPLPFSITSVTTQKTDTFNVSGNGKALVKPDIALVNIGVQTQSSTVKAAQQELNSKINQVTSAIKKVGIVDRDIQTTNYSINPNYDYQTSVQRIIGYSASTNLTIKIRNLDQVNDVIDSATENGANTVSGISFDVDDKTKALNEARQKAVAEAKTKAVDAAKIAGFTLGKIINYNENLDNGFRPPIAMMAIKADGGGRTESTQIEPGSSELTIEVTLSYEIK